MRLLDRCAAALAAASLLFAAPAQACWDAETTASARLQEFHVRMTVAQLRCEAVERPFIDKLAEFYYTHGERIQAAETRVREAMAEQVGADRQAYRRYLTDLGNRYGNGKTSRSFCALMAEVLGELSAQDASIDDLHTYALLLVREPMIERNCPVVLASAAAE